MLPCPPETRCLVSEDLHVCIDRELPEDKLAEAAKAAIAENPENKPHGPAVLAAANQPPSFMALLTGKKWKPGRTLRVRFLGGAAAAVQQKVEKFAHQWE